MVLDEGLGKLAQANIAKSFEGYDLTEEEREILAGGDPNEPGSAFSSMCSPTTTLPEHAVVSPREAPVSEVGRYLRAVVLDEGLGKLAQANIAKSFEGYDLTEEEREILAGGDHRILALLGEALRAEGVQAHPAPAARDLKPTVESEPAPPPPALALPEIAVKLRLQPQASWEPELRVRYVANLEALPPGPTPAQASGPVPEPPPPMPWDHALGSDAVRQAAVRVRTTRGDRRDALIALVLAMTEET